MASEETSHLVTIRPETADDVRAIRAIHEAAFSTPAEADLVDRLRADEHLTVSLVAEIEGRVVGHVAFSPVHLDPPLANVRGAGLAPLAVLPGHRRQSVGRKLVERGVEDCRWSGFAYVVVLGEPEYYRRFGFCAASRLGLGNEYGVDDEFMVIELKPGVLSGERGVVRYADAFASL